MSSDSIAPRILRQPTIDLRNAKTIPLAEDELLVAKHGSKSVQDDVEYVLADNRVAKAKRSIEVFQGILAAFRDPRRKELQTLILRLAADLPQPENGMKEIIQAVANTPPQIVLFEYRNDEESLGGFLATYDSQIIFLCRKLSDALEACSEEGEAIIKARFLIMTALIHEIGHWCFVQPDLSKRRTSGKHQTYKDFRGIIVGEAESKLGESGYFLEGNLWGGIPTWVFRYIPTRSTNSTLRTAYHMNRKNKRQFSRLDDALVLLRRGNAAHLATHEIAVEALERHVKENIVWIPFSEDELRPVSVMKRTGINASTLYLVNNLKEEADSVKDGRGKDGIANDGKTRQREGNGDEPADTCKPSKRIKASLIRVNGSDIFFVPGRISSSESVIIDGGST